LFSGVSVLSTYGFIGVAVLSATALAGVSVLPGLVLAGVSVLPVFTFTAFPHPVSKENTRNTVIISTACLFISSLLHTQYVKLALSR